MLTLEHVSFQYADKPILKDFSYTFQDGVTTAVTGLSGSGKTTLLYLLCKLQKPTSGVIHNSYQNISVAFQEPRLFPWLTALENLTAVCKDKARAQEYLSALFEEADVGAKYPDELSGGMKQRISLARALLANPDLLLLDEPFRGLDPDTKQRVADLLIREMQGKTCILITHDEDDLSYCGAHLHITGISEV